MSQSMWMLLYRIDRADIEEYESWFHRVHIPEKLSRPGYTWAAHYKASADKGACQYAALFGGSSSRVFHDPSPAQLKLTQTEETRRMMSMRRAGSGTIVVEEWSLAGKQIAPQAAIHSPVCRIRCYDARGHDEDLSAWIVQELAPQLLASGPDDSPAASAVSKFIGVSGAVRHTVIEQYATSPGAMSSPSTWQQRIETAVAKPVADTLELSRIWPST